jgi:hypothetical protein
MPRGVSPLDEARLQGRLWSPEELRPIAWYDASDLSTLTLGASGITAWRDKLGRSALNLTATGNPGLAAVNAPPVSWTPLPVVVFNGTSHLMTGAAISNYAPTTGFSSIAVVRVTNAQGWIGNGDGAPPVWTDAQGWVGMVVKQRFGGQLQGGIYIYNSSDRTIWADLTSSTAPEAGIVYVEFASASSHTVATNMSATVLAGNPAGAQGGNAGASYRLGISNKFLGMELGELLHFAHALSPAQRAKVEGSLAWKWSLRPRLAVPVPRHPHAGRPPLIGD